MKEIRPWSVDSLDGGFFTSQFCPVGGEVKIKWVANFYFSLEGIPIASLDPSSRDSSDHGLIEARRSSD